MSNQANIPAFPCKEKTWEPELGMTKREHFSIQIYASMMSVPASMEERKHSAGWAVKCADFLLAELEKEAQ